MARIFKRALETNEQALHKTYWAELGLFQHASIIEHCYMRFACMYLEGWKSTCFDGFCLLWTNVWRQTDLTVRTQLGHATTAGRMNTDKTSRKRVGHLKEKIQNTEFAHSFKIKSYAFWGSKVENSCIFFWLKFQLKGYWCNDTHRFNCTV